MLVGLKGRLALVQADHRRIAAGTAWVAAFLFVSRLAGAGKEMALAWRYGVGGTVDAYQVSTTVAFWIPVTLVSVFTAVLVPLYVRLGREGAGERGLFTRELHGTLLLLGAVLGGVTGMAGPSVLRLVWNGLSRETLSTAAGFVSGMAPLVPLVLLTGVYGVRIMARERQLNTLLEGITPMALLVFILLGSAADPSLLLWGTVAGTVVHTAAAAGFAKVADGSGPWFRFSRRSRYWGEVYRGAGVMALGQLAMSLITPLDQYTAARFGGGAIAALGYANRIVQLILGLGAMALARGLLPVLSELHALGRGARARHVALRWALLMFGLGSAIAIAGWFLAPLVVVLLFQRGAFSASDARMVTEILRFGFIQVPFYFAGLVLVQYLAGKGRYYVIATTGFINISAKVPLNYLLSSWKGIPGILIATGLMQSFCLAFLSLFILRGIRR